MNIKKIIAQTVMPWFRLCNQNSLDLEKKRRIDLILELEGWLRKFHFHELVNDPKRISLLMELLGTNISEAYYIINYLFKSMPHEGVVCEFGIAQGATSALLAHEINKTNKQLWLFDSFKGLSKGDAKDVLIDDVFKLKTMDAYEGSMAFSVNEVIRRLKQIQFSLSRVTIVPGFIEETLCKTRLPEKVCFAYIDFDLYKPIKATLEFLDVHLSDMCYVVVDDYGFFSSGVKIAVDEFVQEHSGRWSIELPPDFAGHFCVLHKNG